MNDRYEAFTLLIASIGKNIRKVKAIEVEEFNLKSSHVSCLYYLFKEKGNLTAKEICDICEEDKAAVSRSLDYLESQGYIVCESKTEKKYNSNILLTEKGEEIGKIVAQKVDIAVEASSDGITEEKRAILYECLEIISENLQKIVDNKEKK